MQKKRNRLWNKSNVSAKLYGIIESPHTAPKDFIAADQHLREVHCCGGGYGRQAYDHYGYKPRPQNPTQETAPAESTAASQSVPPPEKKNSKR